MEINFSTSSVKNFITNPNRQQQAVKIGKVALYILTAAEGPYATYAAFIQKASSICFNASQVYTNYGKDKAAVLHHLKELGLNVIFIAIEALNNQICMLVIDIYEIGSLTSVFVSEVRHCQLKCLLTLGHIGITCFSIYARMVPSPENIVINVVLKISVDIGKSLNAFYHKEWIEGLGFIAAAGVRGHVNQEHFRYMHRKWTVLNDPQFEKLLARVKLAQDTEFLKNHPMENLREAIENGSEIYTLENGDVMNLGANFSNMGGETVKDMRLTGRIRKLDDGELIELRFKLTRVARERLDTLMGEYKAYNQDQLNEFLRFAGVAQKLNITTKPYFLYVNEKGVDIKEEVGSFRSHEFEWEGLGTVNFGERNTINGLYKNVSASIDGNGTAKDMHMLLSMSGMHQAMVPSTSQQLLRWKIGLLFRTFHPSKAIPFQRSAEFFDLPIPEFIKKITAIEPKMQKTILEKVPQMKQEEVRPGWFEWTIPGLSQEVADAGGRYLFHRVGMGSTMTVQERVVNMLKMGMLSTASRFESGKFIEGMSSYEDIETGGCDYIFTRMGTTKDIHRDAAVDMPEYYEGATFLISLDCLNRGSYQYHDDQWGEKGNSHAYLNHENIVEFSKNQNQFPTWGNEVMLNQTVTMKDVKAIVFPSTKKKNALIAALDKEGLLTVRDGVKYFKDTPVEKFIFSQKQIDEALNAVAIV